MSRKTKLSHLRRPVDLAPEAWQRQLRRQFGREQKFKVENLGDEPVFSEFLVTNPTSGGAYRVAIRGAQPGDNFCACPDFATNDLGTCKHIEFVLARLERRPGGERALRRGHRCRYSEVYLRYGGERQVRFAPVRPARRPWREEPKRSSAPDPMMCSRAASICSSTNSSTTPGVQEVAVRRRTGRRAE